MRLHELTKPESLQQFRNLAKSSNHDGYDHFYDLMEIVKKNGFKPIGSGSYGFVFSHPKYHWVLKIYDSDPLYSRWISFCKQHPDNPFLPKIKGKVTRIVDKFYAVRLEPLVPLTRKKAYMEFRNFLDEYIWDQPESDLYFLSEEDKIHLREVCEFLKQFPVTSLDLHDRNVMQRPDGHLVITDPLAS